MRKFGFFFILVLFFGGVSWYFFVRQKACVEYSPGTRYVGSDYNSITLDACYMGDGFKFDRSENLLTFNLTFFDKWGFGHKYPVRIGWVNKEGLNEKTSFCRLYIDRRVCNMTDVEEIVPDVKKGKVRVEMLVSEVSGYRDMEYIRYNTDYIVKMSKAFLGSGFFPMRSDDLRLPIWTMTVYE